MVFSGISVMNARENYLTTERSFGQKGKFGINIVSNTLVSFKQPSLQGLGFAIGLTDFYGGFNDDYIELDRIQQTQNIYLNLMLFMNNTPVRFK